MSCNSIANYFGEKCAFNLDTYNIEFAVKELGKFSTEGRNVRVRTKGAFCWPSLKRFEQSKHSTKHIDRILKNCADARLNGNAQEAKMLIRAAEEEFRQIDGIDDFHPRILFERAMTHSEQAEDPDYAYNLLCRAVANVPSRIWCVSRDYHEIFNEWKVHSESANSRFKLVLGGLYQTSAQICTAVQKGQNINFCESYVRQIYSTVRIEETDCLSIEKTRELLVRPDPNHQELRSGFEEKQIIGAAQAFFLVLNHMRTRIGLSTELITALNKLVLLEHADDPKSSFTPGKFRSDEPGVSPDRFAQLMHKFVQFCNTQLNSVRQGKLDPISLAAFAHSYIGVLHPFKDGNGRVSRCVMNYILMSSGFPPVIIDPSRPNKLRYIDVLMEYNRGATRPFELFIAQQLGKTMEDLLRYSPISPPQKVLNDVEDNPPSTIHHSPSGTEADITFFCKLYSDALSDISF